MDKQCRSHSAPRRTLVAEVTRFLGALWLHDRLHFVILQIEFWKGGCLVINGITLIEILQFHHPTM